MAYGQRILVKLLPTTGLAAAPPRANLRPLYGPPAPTATPGLAAAPTWYLADLTDAGPLPWDAAHSQVAAQLGIDESAVLFAEPDLEQHFRDVNDTGLGEAALAATGVCTAVPQSASNNRVRGPDRFAWHLEDDYSQLGLARDLVPFSDPRTRIAHIDTGYDRNHAACPEHILNELEHNFADVGDAGSAQDPKAGHAFPDNSGHGTGTIGILAGGRVAAFNDNFLGGAPQADIVPIRISNSVILFHTSAFAQALQWAIWQSCDVLSISMGGLPSKAWSDAVNDAYMAGICIVAAAGNNVVGLPTHHVVYPARYHRTIAACGAMANGQPYYHISADALQGNWGPDSCMTAAIASYTPNIPWPVFGCGSTIRLNGEGTSAATPQVAAAVALWYEKFKDSLPRDWRRVEAVRNALFTSAKAADPQYTGHGIIQAKAALAVAPALNLPQTPPDRDSFAFLRVLTGLGIADPPVRETMFNLEVTQRWLDNPQLQEIVPDPEDGAIPDKKRREFVEAVIHDEKASLRLRRHLANRYPLVFGSSVQGAPAEIVQPPHPVSIRNIEPSDPPFRRVRTYAVDPSFSTRLETASINEAVLKLRWEKLEPGPTGEYLEVTDTDVDGRTYVPVDLNDPRLLAQDGIAPAEGNPAFHQQMVYAVAMRTIEHFERALGRPVLWRPTFNPQREVDDSTFAPRLKIRPHALHQANAYYSPQEGALLFGYFEAASDDPGDHVPGSMVYTCLSHDIVAHETTHAILDGMHRRFNQASNPDVLAFHEAFADIVALMQHFTVSQILEHEIGRSRGNLEAESMLGSLAVQFGRATGGRRALRDAIGTIDKTGKWTRLPADPAAYLDEMLPHARGGILVAAVFDAFLAIYETRTADLLRIYTGGTGILPSGAIHPDLARRLADEAATSAGHALNMCIRALDYIPPVDITFGEYLRGIITADFDLVEDDRYNYRVAFVEAFRRRGLHPQDLATLSVDTLRWQGMDAAEAPRQYRPLVQQLKRYANACFYITTRRRLFQVTRRARARLHETLDGLFKTSPGFAALLGLDPKLDFEVHELRACIRVGPDGQHKPEVIVALTQSRRLQIDGGSGGQSFRGGSTLIVDLLKPEVKYRIVKNIDSAPRQQRTAAFLSRALGDPLRALLIAPDQREPFAGLHLLADTIGA